MFTLRNRISRDIRQFYKVLKALGCTSNDSCDVVLHKSTEKRYASQDAHLDPKLMLLFCFRISWISLIREQGKWSTLEKLTSKLCTVSLMFYSTNEPNLLTIYCCCFESVCYSKDVLVDEQTFKSNFVRAQDGIYHKQKFKKYNF